MPLLSYYLGGDGWNQDPQAPGNSNQGSGNGLQILCKPYNLLCFY